MKAKDYLFVFAACLAALIAGLVIGRVVIAIFLEGATNYTSHPIN